MANLTKKQYVDSVVAEVMSKPKMYLGGHGMSTQLVSMMATRPDILFRLAVIAYSTTNWKKGAKALRVSPQFKIFAYRKSAEFVKNSIPDIASFQNALMGTDADNFTSNGNVVGILALVDKPSGDVSEDMVALKSESMPYSKITDKAYASMGAMFICVCVTNSYIRPIEAVKAEAKANVNARILARKTAAKVKAEIMAKTKNKSKLEKINTETKALSTEAALLKAEIDQAKKIDKQLGLAGKSFKGAVSKANAAKKAELNALPLEDRKNLKMVMELFKQNRQSVALTLLTEFVPSFQSKITEQKALDLLSYDDAFSHYAKYARRFEGAMETLQEEKAALEALAKSSQKPRPEVTRKIEAINKKIVIEEAKLGIASDLKSGKSVDTILSSKVKMLDKLNARIAENKASGMSLKNALKGAVAELPVSEPQKVAIEDQVTQEVLDGANVEDATLNAISDVVDVEFGENKSHQGYKTEEVNELYNSVVSVFTENGLVLMEDAPERMRVTILELLGIGYGKSYIIENLLEYELTAKDGEGDNRFTTDKPTQTIFDEGYNVDDVIEFKTLARQIEVGKIYKIEPAFNGRENRYLINGINGDSKSYTVIASSIIGLVSKNAEATIEDIVKHFDVGHTPYDLYDLDWFDKAVEWYQKDANKMVTDETKVELFDYITELLNNENADVNPFKVGDVVAYKEGGERTVRIIVDAENVAVSNGTATESEYEYVHISELHKVAPIENNPFKVGDVVGNSRTNTIGIVRDVFDFGEVRTDADGVVPVSELTLITDEAESYTYQIAPSTRAELGWNETAKSEQEDEAFFNELKNRRDESAQDIFERTDYDVRDIGYVYSLSLGKLQKLELSGEVSDAVVDEFGIGTTNSSFKLNEISNDLNRAFDNDPEQVTLTIKLAIEEAGFSDFADKITAMFYRSFDEWSDEEKAQLSATKNNPFIVGDVVAHEDKKTIRIVRAIIDAVTVGVTPIGKADGYENVHVTDLCEVTVENAHDFSNYFVRDSIKQEIGWLEYGVEMEDNPKTVSDLSSNEKLVMKYGNKLSEFCSWAGFDISYVFVNAVDKVNKTIAEKLLDTRFSYFSENYSGFGDSDLDKTSLNKMTASLVRSCKKDLNLIKDVCVYALNDANFRDLSSLMVKDFEEPAPAPAPAPAPQKGISVEEGDVVAESTTKTITVVIAVTDDGVIVDDLETLNDDSTLTEISSTDLPNYSDYRITDLAKTMLGIEPEPDTKKSDSIQDILSFL